MADKGELSRFEASDAPEPLPLPAIEEPEASSSKETETFIYDPSTGFNDEEINYLQSNSLPLPQDLVKTSDYEGVLDDVKILGDKSYRYLYNLGWSKKKNNKIYFIKKFLIMKLKKNDENLFAYDTLEKYKNEVKLFEKAMIKVKQGKSIFYCNNPHQLLDRFELLGGSILAGNNGVIPEFSQIAHLLNQMTVISKK